MPRILSKTPIVTVFETYWKSLIFAPNIILESGEFFTFLVVFKHCEKQLRAIFEIVGILL